MSQNKNEKNSQPMDNQLELTTETESERIEMSRSDVPSPDEYAAEIIESVLFAAGHPVKYSTFASLMQIGEEEVKAIVSEYAEKYNNSDLQRGVILLMLDDCCQLCTKHAYLPYIRAALGIRRNGNLSASSIETLAIVAYNQPVTRAYIDAVRKVDSSYSVSSLLERGLIESKGRLDAPGRPMLYGTTPDFLRCFGLNSLDELPAVMSEETEEIFERIGKQLALDVDTDKNQLAFDIPKEEKSEIERETDLEIEAELEAADFHPETDGSHIDSEME